MTSSPGPVLVLAAVALPAGFAVADATGFRSLGGLVLAALAIAAVVAARARARAAAAFLLATVLAFAASHALAGVLTAWGAVAVAAAAVALAAARVLLQAE